MRKTLFKNFTRVSRKFSIFFVAIVIVGCQKKPPSEEFQISVNQYPYFEAELNQLKSEISRLERRITQDIDNKTLEPQKDEMSQIRSITLRIGSKDDRIRIYWKDGSKTDLPCTKEQNIWACG